MFAEIAVLAATYEAMAQMEQEKRDRAFVRSFTDPESQILAQEILRLREQNRSLERRVSSLNHQEKKVTNYYYY